MEEKCGVCLSPEEWHKERAAANMATLLMMKQVSESLPTEYAETLDQILIDWRTHTLPTCDPSAIK
jgi:hypothetical protein